MFPEFAVCPRLKCNHGMDVYGDHLLHCNKGDSLGNAPLVWFHDAQLRFLAADLRRVSPYPQLEYRAQLSHKSLQDFKCIGEQVGTDYIEMSIVHPLSCPERMSITINKPTVSLKALETLKINQQSEIPEGSPVELRLLVFGMTTTGGRLNRQGSIW